jgi:hypothetical protein
MAKIPKMQNFCSMAGYAAPIGSSRIGRLSVTAAKPVRSSQSLRVTLPNAFFAEQPAWPDQQHDHGDQVDDDVVDPRNQRLDFVHRREGLKDAEQEARGHRAA